MTPEPAREAAPAARVTPEDWTRLDEIKDVATSAGKLIDEMRLRCAECGDDGLVTNAEGRHDCLTCGGRDVQPSVLVPAARPEAAPAARCARCDLPPDAREHDSRSWWYDGHTFIEPARPEARDPLDAIYERTASALHAVREERDDLRAQLRDAETRERALRETVARAVHDVIGKWLTGKPERHEPNCSCSDCYHDRAMMVLADELMAAVRAALKETER